MEETNKAEKLSMSPFCEALMGVTESLHEMRQNGDTALIICSDGKTMASRQYGLYPDALTMIYAKMKTDDKFAELITEAALCYSQWIRGKRSEEPFKEDTPINNANIKPIN